MDENRLSIPVSLEFSSHESIDSRSFSSRREREKNNLGRLKLPIAKSDGGGALLFFSTLSLCSNWSQSVKRERERESNNRSVRDKLEKLARKEAS